MKTDLFEPSGDMFTFLKNLLVWIQKKSSTKCIVFGVLMELRTESHVRDGGLDDGDGHARGAEQG